MGFGLAQHLVVGASRKILVVDPLAELHGHPVGGLNAREGLAHRIAVDHRPVKAGGQGPGAAALAGAHQAEDHHDQAAHCAPASAYSPARAK